MVNAYINQIYSLEVSAESLSLQTHPDTESRLRRLIYSTVVRAEPGTRGKKMIQDENIYLKLYSSNEK